MVSPKYICMAACTPWTSETGHVHAKDETYQVLFLMLTTFFSGFYWRHWFSVVMQGYLVDTWSVVFGVIMKTLRSTWLTITKKKRTWRRTDTKSIYWTPLNNGQKLGRHQWKCLLTDQSQGGLENWEGSSQMKFCPLEELQDWEDMSSSSAQLVENMAITWRPVLEENNIIWLVILTQ